MEMPARIDSDDQGDVTADAGQRSFFGKLGSRMAWRGDAAPNLQTHDALLLLQNYEDSGQGWFWSTDAKGRLTYITDSVAQLMGRTSGQLLGTAFTELFLSADNQGERQRTLRFLLTKQSKFEELPLRSAFEGDDRWWAVSGRPYFDNGGGFAGYRGSGMDVTAQRQSAEDASRLALYDSLTGLANRFNISKTLDTTLAAFATQRRSCAMMLLDLDRFKQVNDTLGHPAGDELLKQVAERLLRIVGDKERSAGWAATNSRSSFPTRTIAASWATSPRGSSPALSQPYSIEGSRCIIGASVGIAIAPTTGCQRRAGPQRRPRALCRQGRRARAFTVSIRATCTRRRRTPRAGGGAARCARRGELDACRLSAGRRSPDRTW